MCDNEDYLVFSFFYFIPV